MQLPLGFLVPKSEWTAPALADLPSDWNVFQRVAIDCETKDPTLNTLGIGVRRGGYIVGVSIAFEDGPRFYLPVRHGGGGNIDPAQVFSYLRSQAARFTGCVVGAHLAYDLDYLFEEGVEFKSLKFFRDVLIAEPLIYELEFKYNLDDVGLRRIGVGKDESMLIDAAKAYGAKSAKDVKKILWALPAELVAPYAIQDSAMCHSILREQEKHIEEQGLWEVFNLESEVLPALVRMRRRGVRINIDKVTQMNTWSLREEAEALAEIKRLTGVEIPVGDTMKAEVVAPALRAIGIEPKKAAKGGLSITKYTLAEANHPVADLIRVGRRMSQLRSTFINPALQHVTNGRIHGTFNQLVKEKDDGRGIEGAITGRLSAVDPNLQQQLGESAEELGEAWRDIYEPEEGATWTSKDYSQQEPRWLVHWSVCAGERRIGEFAYKAAIEFAQRYNENPDTDFHDMTASFVNDGYYSLESSFRNKKRKQAKIVGLARIYGRGGASMCRQLGLPVITQEKLYGGKKIVQEIAGPEGQAIIDRFDARVPFARAMLKADTGQAEQYGFVRTWSERRLHFLTDAHGNYIKGYTGLNKRIQGSGADQTKKALVELDKAGYFIQIQVHDEINSSASSIKEGKDMASIMENCMPMKVPSKVDLAMGPSWGKAEKVL